ncbi:hypothetical protein F53441_10284 [Fusarium austroafricanum]|uniref:Uncharacterized protein n=1 Tax=Fusarium austroafricanum TaxID=2364996 RepID=A0A8H4NVJ6_9HYPO|nr:hypothetical protein F53441_10284 [Fusarium austroafricanum]
MKTASWAALLMAIGINGVQGALISESPLCKYERLSVASWNKCGARDPYKDSDCDLPCARAGMKEGGKFVHVSNLWGNGDCALQCWLR